MGVNGGEGLKGILLAGWDVIYRAGNMGRPDPNGPARIGPGLNGPGPLRPGPHFIPPNYKPGPHAIGPGLTYRA